MTPEDSSGLSSGDPPKPIANGLVSGVGVQPDLSDLVSIPVASDDQILLATSKKSIATLIGDGVCGGVSENRIEIALRELKTLVADVVEFLYDLYPADVEPRKEDKVVFAFAAEASDEWTFMPVPEEGVMLFNANLLLTGAASYELFKSIVAHELCHYFVQGLRSKKQVKQLKKNFSSLAVEQTDVLADVIAYDYLRTRQGLTRTSAFELMRESIALFRRPKWQEPEYVSNNTRRDIGTALSVAALYENNARPSGGYSYCLVGRIFEQQVDLQGVTLVPTGSPVTLRSGYAIETEATASFGGISGPKEQPLSREYHVQRLGPQGLFWHKIVLTHSQVEFIKSLYTPGDEYRPCANLAEEFAILAASAAVQAGLIGSVVN